MRCPMNIINNNKGIAMVTSLMLTLISLTIVMALLYIITQGIQFSGLNKKYHTALEASYGGTEIMLKDILPVVFSNYSSPTLKTDLENKFSKVDLQLRSQSCFQNKLTKATDSWLPECQTGVNPKQNPDIRFTMQGTSGNQFYVYSKIVDTVIGNTDLSGLQLEGTGVTESQATLSPQSFPYIYRVEVQGERSNNSTAQANIEVLYAY
jgi:hypothetical protein